MVMTVTVARDQMLANSRCLYLSDCRPLTEIPVTGRSTSAADCQAVYLHIDNKYLAWVYGVDRKICHEGH